MDIRREFYDDIDSEMDEYRRWELFSLGKLAFFLSDIVAWFQDLPRPVRWFLKAVFWAAVAAAVIWLFVLRPWLVGRWPDLRVLAFAVAIFWQQDVVYYFDSVYMEPWPLVLCLPVIEVLIDRGEVGAPVACLLIGAAATVKEPAIFALPFVWLAGAPWRGTWSERCRLTGCALAAGVPFVLYFVARGSVAADAVETSRGFALGLPQEPLAQLVHDFAQRLAA